MHTCGPQGYETFLYFLIDTFLSIIVFKKWDWGLIGRAFDGL